MSNSDVSGRTPADCDAVFTALAAENRREILRIVGRGSADGVAKSEIALELAAVDADGSPEAVADEDQQRTLLECHHTLFPSLIEAGLIVESEPGTIERADHWLYEDPDFRSILDDRSVEAELDLDSIFEALADSRRRTVLSILENVSQPVSIETLARDVASYEAGTSDIADPPAALERVRIALHHVHVPLLCDAGLLERDDETDRLTVCESLLSRVSSSRGASNGTPGPRTDVDERSFDSDDDGERRRYREERIFTTG